MARIGLVELRGGDVAFTPRGEARARSVIRRHRLAERLFMDVLAIRDEGSIEKNACMFEHVLSPEVTDRICTFLGHPRTCPHGSPMISFTKSRSQNGNSQRRGFCENQQNPGDNSAQ